MIHPRYRSQARPLEAESCVKALIVPSPCCRVENEGNRRFLNGQCLFQCIYNNKVYIWLLGNVLEGTYS